MSIKGKTIFIGPQEIAGLVSRNAQALASEGANIIAFKQKHSRLHPEMATHKNIEWLLPRTIRYISKLPSALQTLIQFPIRIWVLVVAICKVDACLMIGGKSMFTIPVDYYLLRLFGKRVVHLYVGTSSRPRYLSAYAKKALQSNKNAAKAFTRKLIKRTRRQRARINSISKAASYVIENPLSGHFQTRPFINYYKIGTPITINTFEPKKPGIKNSKTRILHCPSRPEIKGTARIIETLNEKALEKLNAELIVLTGVPHNQVIEEISKCDFVIDQLYSDSPIAGFSAEAASQNKMAIIGGYGWEELKQSAELSELPPTLICAPNQLLEAVEKLCRDKKIRTFSAEGLRSFFADGPWSARNFARNLGILLTEKIPNDWLVDPYKITYKHGVGLHENEVKSIIRCVIKYGGIDALQLQGKEHFIKNILNWLDMEMPGDISR